ETSACPRAERRVVPAKITSSMPSPRIAVGRFSPMTQRSASSRLDFPHPFGPTTPVSPSRMTRSVGSTKLLKPLRRRRSNRKGGPFQNQSYWGLLPRDRYKSTKTPYIDRISKLSTRSADKSGCEGQPVRHQLQPH